MEIKKFVLKQILDIKTYGIKELFRKFYLLIKKLLVIPVNIIAIVPCLIIRLISPWIIIRMSRIPCANYGNFVRDLTFYYCYYCKKRLKIELLEKKYIDLLYISPKDKIYNRQIAKMWKRKLNIVSGHLLEPIDKIGKFIPGWKVSDPIVVCRHQHAFKKRSQHLGLYFDNLIEKHQPLSFTIEEEIYGRKMLNKFGLKKDSKFVCLAVRDNAYQLKKIPSRFRDWSYHDYRHWDLDNFILAAEELTKRGYYVFRMGVVVNKPFNTNNLKIIDYANSDLRSDFMDVYLGAKCSFCISTGYGFDELPYIFGRPTALISLPLGDLRAYSEKYILLTKHHILKKEKRKLSLSEIFSHGVAYAEETKIFEEKGIELIDNSPNEIKDLALEMAENVESKKTLNFEDQKLQKTFKDLFASNIKHTDPPMHKKLINLANVPIKSSFSTKFLRENRNWLK